MDLTYEKHVVPSAVIAVLLSSIKLKKYRVFQYHLKSSVATIEASSIIYAYVVELETENLVRTPIIEVLLLEVEKY